MGRRGTYPVAPGLEEYIDSLRGETMRVLEAEAAVQREEDQRDTSTKYAKSMKALQQQSRKDESTRLLEREQSSVKAVHAEKVRVHELKRGLMMRFRVNVSEYIILYLYIGKGPDL